MPALSSIQLHYVNRKWIGFVLCLSLSWFWFPSEVYACSCGWVGPFLNVASTSDLIIRGKVIGVYKQERGIDIDLAMDVEVQEVLRGTEGSKEIRIWGDNGMLCRPYVREFPIGTEWVFAISKVGGVSGKWLSYEEGGYTISICGAYWLKVDGHEAIGHISSKEMTEAEQHMNLNILRDQLFNLSTQPK